MISKTIDGMIIDGQYGNNPGEVFIKIMLGKANFDLEP